MPMSITNPSLRRITEALWSEVMPPIVLELSRQKFTAVMPSVFSRTAVVVLFNNTIGSLPTRNYTEGQFEGCEPISGEKMAEVAKVLTAWVQKVK